MSNPVDYDIGTPTSASGQYKNENVKAAQNQVNEVVGIMQSNVEKMMLRDEKLERLEGIAMELDRSAQEFQTTSRKVKRKYWWKNTKMILILGSVGILIFIIIIISIVGIPSSSDSGSDSSSHTETGTPDSNMQA